MLDLPGNVAMIRKPVLKPVKCRLSSLGREDTETLIKIWNRVGRHRFKFLEVADITPNNGFARKMSAKSIFERDGMEFRLTVWRINPDVCNRFELTEMRT